MQSNAVMITKLTMDQMSELRNHDVQWSQSCRPIIFIAYYAEDYATTIEDFDQ